MQVYRQASCTLPAAHCTHATVLRRPMSLTARSDSARAPLGVQLVVLLPMTVSPLQQHIIPSSWLRLRAIAVP